MPISRLFVERSVSDHALAKSIEKTLAVSAEIIDDPSAVYNEVSSAPDPVKRGKEVLFLTQNKGAFMKECPGTTHYTCCDYKILHIGTFCTMDCSYCILQAYFHPPVLQYFLNQDQMLSELDTLFQSGKISRVGTGEFTDSMIWELWTDLSDTLVPKFAAQSSAILELKTKTTAIDRLKHLDHNRKTITSWSLNTERVIASDERGTASLEARMKAAAQCASWGYPLAFHFDPVVIYEGCEAEYRQVIKKLFSHVSPDQVVYISIGSFRFIPTLKKIIQKRFAHSKIVYGEFITGLDNKMRYFKPLRIAVYREIVNCIREYAPNVLVYFCMEDDEVWEKSMGFVPASRGSLGRMLDESVIKHCNVSEKK